MSEAGSHNTLHVILPSELRALVGHVSCAIHTHPHRATQVNFMLAEDRRVAGTVPITPPDQARRR